MSSRIALIISFGVCCIVHTADAVTWTTTCPLDIPEDIPKENLYVFMADESPSGYIILTQNVTGRFSIAPNGTLSSDTKLDYESIEKAYYIEIMAFNNTGTPRNANLTCEIRVTDVNDEQPQFNKQSYSVNIPNDVANDTNVLNVSAVDSDVSDAFNKVVYSIKEGGDRANFTINSNSGVIKAANNLTGPHTFMITVLATDNDNAEFKDEASVSMCIRCTSGSSSLEISIFAFMALVFGIVLM